MDPTLSLDAGLFSAKIAELNHHFGKTQGDIVQAISDGKLTPSERQLLIVRLKGLVAGAEDLINALGA